ncbi:hypothetical protein ACFXK0_00890 [Nocardia sp. NPDC059177]|uniref:hypothetical protein n=1 Tax=Nocardia sp. NPDC059177 TaxID=3346759 RepID=UPI00369E0491
MSAEAPAGRAHRHRSERSGSDIRDTPEFEAIQGDERFQSWLLMHDAAMQIEFTVFDVPELDGHEFTREGLMIAEQEIVRRFGASNLFSTENCRLGMRFYYFIGETFRRNLDGRWVALPPEPPRTNATSAVDLPFRSGFQIPRYMMGFVHQRRTGNELTKIFDRAGARHKEWVELGRPARGTWEGYL